MAQSNLLSNAGKERLFELIRAGERDSEIARILVKEGFAEHYTKQAVNRYRSTDEVKAMLASRGSQALQAGWASRERRVVELGNLAESLQRKLIRRNDRGELVIGKVTKTNRDGEEYETDMDEKGLAMLVRELTNTVQVIGSLVDIGEAKKLDVKVQGQIDGGALLGLPSSPKEMAAMLSEAAGVLQEQEHLELPAPLTPFREEAEDVEVLS